MIKKSIFAALLIAFGMFVLVAAPTPIGTFLFAFGLMSICYCDGYLYTGKCGYAIENKSYIQTLQILLINLIAGWIFGFIISYIYPYAYVFGQQRIQTWINPLIHFIQAIGCGAIMFLAVDIKKKHNMMIGERLRREMQSFFYFFSCKTHKSILSLGCQKEKQKQI